MPDYFVTVDHEEVNELANACSITGTVNGVPCAAVIRCSALAGKDAKAEELVKLWALVDAFKERMARPAPQQPGATKVTL